MKHVYRYFSLLELDLGFLEDDLKKVVGLLTGLKRAVTRVYTYYVMLKLVLGFLELTARARKYMYIYMNECMLDGSF